VRFQLVECVVREVHEARVANDRPQVPIMRKANWTNLGLPTERLYQV
jgi:hypothetical protein